MAQLQGDSCIENPRGHFTVCTYLTKDCSTESVLLSTKTFIILHSNDLFQLKFKAGYYVDGIIIYSSVPNRNAGPNKRAGGKILEKQ